MAAVLLQMTSGDDACRMGRSSVCSLQWLPCTTGALHPIAVAHRAAWISQQCDARVHEHAEPLVGLSLGDLQVYTPCPMITGLGRFRVRSGYHLIVWGMVDVDRACGHIRADAPSQPLTYHPEHSGALSAAASQGAAVHQHASLHGHAGTACSSPAMCPTPALATGHRSTPMLPA